MENFIKDIEIVNQFCKNRALLSNIVSPFIFKMSHYNNENKTTNLIYDWYVEFNEKKLSIKNIDTYIYISINKFYDTIENNILKPLDRNIFRNNTEQDNIISELEMQQKNFLQLIDSVSYNMLCISEDNKQFKQLLNNISNWGKSILYSDDLINFIMKISFIKYFVYSNELFDMLNKQDYIVDLLFNAAKKYRDVDFMNQTTFEVYREYRKLSGNFNKSRYKEFLIVYAYAHKPIIQLDADDIVLTKVDKNTMLKKILNNDAYRKLDLKRIVEFLEYERYSHSESLENFINGILEIPKLIKKLMVQKTKNDLLGNKMNENDFYSLTAIDNMSGTEFEQVVARLFFNMGYTIKMTKTTNDQGVDIIATRDNEKIAIQVKRYSGTVGNHAIMEAVAGMKFYGANECMVITNSYFSKSAIRLAKVNNVILWDRNILKKRLNEK